MKNKRSPASPQAIIYMSADKVVARAAAALDCSSKDAVEHLYMLVRSGRLSMFERELLDDGTHSIRQIEGEELRGARLELDNDSHVRHLSVARTGVVGFVWSKAQILFQEVDIDQLWPPPVEQVLVPPSPKRRKPGPAPKGDWHLWYASELIAMIVLSKGKVPPNDAKAASNLSNQFADTRKDGWAPDDREVRELIGQLLRRARGISP
jgi:hypothetical protein